MSRYKVCVYAVCKDEEQFVDRFMVNLKEADMVIIGDTGSTDSLRIPVLLFTRCQSNHGDLIKQEMSY